MSHTDNDQSLVSETNATYIANNTFANRRFKSQQQKDTHTVLSPLKLSPIIKWPGGKETELKFIIPNLPAFRDYYEPFVGGGSVFTAIHAENYFINDLSDELITLYKNIASGNSAFYHYSELINSSWKNSKSFFINNTNLIDTYKAYRNEYISKQELKSSIHKFCKCKEVELKQLFGEELFCMSSVIQTEFEKNLFRKMTRMKVLETEKNILPENDLSDNIETAIKSAVYMNYRDLYNNKDISISNPDLHSALFLFMRNYAYSGMFRYSKKGEFNVPYGGIAYNSKTIEKKLYYYQSLPLSNLLCKTKIFNLDFEDFLNTTNPSEEDFVFLDPPYDSEFSTYAKNSFTKADQKRLADFLTKKCRAKWMLIIKHTDYIYNLYNQPGISINSFDKEYVVSFMNRNNKKATHLIIKNY